jgi:HAMP domain-containing protein
MDALVNFIKKRMALKIALFIGAIMLILMAGMAFFLTRQQVKEHVETMNDFLLSKSKLAADIGAKMYGTIIEQACDTGMITVAEAFDKDYQLIDGYEWGKVPKYHTKYDSILDNTVLGFEDKMVEDPDFAFAVGVDVNGYLPVHNTNYQKSLTGDLSKDLVGNRSKRIFDDPTGIAAAKNTKPGFLQVYKRDTGETMWDVSSPIYVKAQHWGGFRMGVRMSKVEERTAAVLRSLVLWFVSFVIIVLAFLFFQLNRAMKPIRQLTDIADEISSGENLDKPIATKAIDEIGRLTKSLDRLRSSMKAAIERLGE